MITTLASDPLFEFQMNDIERQRAQNYEHFRQDNELAARSLFSCTFVIFSCSEYFKMKIGYSVDLLQALSFHEEPL